MMTLSSWWPPSSRRLVACVVALHLGMLTPLAGWPQAEQTALPQGSVLPALGESVARQLSPAAERAMGDRAMRDIWRDPDVVDDPVLLEYVQDIWSALLRSSRARGELTADLDAVYAWRPFLIADPEVNAFAMPGGYMGVFMGLLALTDTRDELASVLAHELSHITQRHIARMLDASPKFSALSLATMVLGALAASRNPQAGEAIMVTGQAAAASGELKFSRDMEREADRIGLSVLSGAGFSPVGMAGMFEKLEEASRLNDDNNFPFLRDHPLTTERIGEARERLGVAAFSAHPAPDPVHALMQARASVLMDHRSTHLLQILDQEKFLDQPAQPSSAAGASGTQLSPKGSPIELRVLDRDASPLAKAYAVALAATRLHRWTQADHALNQAQGWAAQLPESEQAAVSRQLKLLAVESMIERGNEAGARQGLSLLQGDDSRPVLVERARWALMGGHDEAVLHASASNLEEHVSLHGEDSLAWSLLSRTWSLLGQPLRSVRADAESYAAHNDLAAAIDRLRGGQHLAGRGKSDPIEAAVIDSRLRQLESRQRQEEQEERAKH